MANLMFYDDETANTAQIICQVGFEITDMSGNVLETYQTLVNPYAKFDWQCTRVHGLRYRDVASAPGMREVARHTLTRHLKENILVAHGATSADLHHIAKSYRAAGIEMPPIRYIDTMALANRIQDMPKKGLAALCERYGISCEGHHDALADAIMLRRVFWPLVDEVGTPSICVAIDRDHANVAQRIPANYQIKLV